jgi:hypothetical protein
VQSQSGHNKRSTLLSFVLVQPSPEQQSALACELRRTLDWAQSQNELLFSRTPAASELWNERYDALSHGREDAYGIP